MVTSEWKDAEKSPKFSRSRVWIQQRYYVAIMGFLCITMQYILKANLSVAIVAMTKPLISSVSNESVLSDDEIKDPKEGEFSWDMETQGHILSAYYYGYLTTQFFGGYAANRWGGKIVVGPGMALTGFLTLLSPEAARQGGPWALFAVRVLEGVCSGVILPGMHHMFSDWFPPQERNSFAGAVFSGILGGAVIGTAASGPLSKWPLDGGGWPMVFYFFGAIAVVLIVPWWLLVYDNPETHPHISNEEKNYILEGLGKEKDKTKQLEAAPVQWLSMLTDIHLWTGMIFHWGAGWVLYTMLTDLPTYMKNVLHYDIQKLSFLSALPSLLNWVSCVLTGILSQWLRRKKYLSHIAAYKIFNAICGLGSAACLIGVTQVGFNPDAIVVLFALTGFCSGFIFGGSYTNHMDLAVNYVGITSGILHTVINSSGIMIPPVVAAIVNGKQTLEQWAKVFYLSAGISAGVYILYLIFGSVEERPWNNPNRLNGKKKTEGLRKNEEINPKENCE